MFEPHDIVDPSDKFLEDKGGAPLLAAVAAVQRNRHRINRALWMTGGALCTLSTLILAVSLGPWGDTEKLSVETRQSTSQRAVENMPQASKVERPSTTPSLAQSPKAQQPEEVGSAVQPLSRRPTSLLRQVQRFAKWLRGKLARRQEE